MHILGLSQQKIGSNGDGNQVPFVSVVEKPPVAKKPKRVVDESELSEGEILSDDEEEETQ